MADPPPKRRKTTPDATNTEDANNGNANAPFLRQPSVTHRQSFQSPTRSSLARSNPDVLSHVLARSPTRSPQRQQQGIPFGLRDRKALRPSLITNNESSPLRALSQSPRRGGVVAASQQQVFAAPPRRISRKIESPTRDVAGDSEVERRERVDTTPIRHDNPDDQLASELDSATRELEYSGLLAPSSLNDDLPEPELPPTPTQLGREKSLKASQDLLSSPSLGRRLRRDLSGPSKLSAADTVPTQHIREDEDEEVDDPAMQERKKLKRDLLAQLDELKADVALLENWTNRAKRNDGGHRADQEDVLNLM